MLASSFPAKCIRKALALRADIFGRSSYGLDGLDLRLLERIGPRRGGYYCELGAYDGVEQSNTYLLQKKYGWSGILVEPSSRQFVDCIRNRDFAVPPRVVCAACVHSDYEGEFVSLTDSGMMSVASGLDIDSVSARSHAREGLQFLADERFSHCYGACARTLSSILDEVGAPADFDLLSLDVEGNELSVLKGIDWAIHRPIWILCEVRGPQVGQYLAERGYGVDSVLTRNGEYSDVLFNRETL